MVSARSDEYLLSLSLQHQTYILVTNVSGYFLPNCFFFYHEGLKANCIYYFSVYETFRPVNRQFYIGTYLTCISGAGREHQVYLGAADGVLR